MRTIYGMVLFCLLNSACGESQDVQPQSKLPEIYERLISASLDTSLSDTNLIETILDSVQISKEEFDEILINAQENPEIWIATLDSLLKELNLQQAQDQSQ